MVTERWAPVVGMVGLYEVSDRGRVRSLDRVVVTKNGVRKRRKGRMLRQTIVEGNGYPRLSLSPGGGRSTQAGVLVHALVLEAFVGPRPAGADCRHADGSRSNNHLENLSWGTRAENMADAVRHGTFVRGSAVKLSKLSEATAAEIYRRRRGGESGKGLAKEFGISQQQVCNIVKGRCWHWLTQTEEL